MTLSLVFNGHVMLGTGSWDSLCLACFGEGCTHCTAGFVRNREEPEITKAGKGLYKAYVWLKNHKVFPDAGAWLDQSAKFLKAVEWMDLVSSKYAKTRERHNKMAEQLVSRVKNGR